MPPILETVEESPDPTAPLIVGFVVWDRFAPVVFEGMAVSTLALAIPSRMASAS